MKNVRKYDARTIGVDGFASTDLNELGPGGVGGVGGLRPHQRYVLVEERVVTAYAEGDEPEGARVLGWCETDEWADIDEFGGVG